MTKRLGNMAPSISENEKAPHINVSIAAGHGHVLATQLTDSQAEALRSGAATSVVLSTEGGTHIHDYTITWDGEKFVGVDQFDSHQHDLLIEVGFKGNVPFNKDLATAGSIGSANRFALVRDLTVMDGRFNTFEELADSRAARYVYADMDRAMELCPGLDGAGAVIQESYDLRDGTTDILQDRDGGILNAAYYNRHYNFERGDASGRQSAHRGFNDPNMYTAKTNNPSVLFGQTWAIPFEINVKTPINSWNPHGIVEVPRTDLTAEKQSGAGEVQGAPFSGYNIDNYYMLTPYSLYNDNQSDADPADTGRNAWMTDANGNSVRCYGAGQWIHTPDGVHRTRIPVFPVAEEFSYGASQLNVFKEHLKDLLKQISPGNAEVIEDTF